MTACKSEEPLPSYLTPTSEVHMHCNSLQPKKLAYSPEDWQTAKGSYISANETHKGVHNVTMLETIAL